MALQGQTKNLKQSEQDKTGEAKPTKYALRNKGSGRASYKARRRSTSFTTF